ncbi:MAG: agmatine deiminase family protein, partial [Thaumarchaeota archaeon]|nr:agmatine deiminase family protein [Nitrososphaerota archaeon]
RTYVEMIDALATGERVDLLVDDEDTEARVRSMLSARNVRFHQIKSADVWIRDYGPIFVKKGGREGRVTATKWKFNAWGAKYDDLFADDETGLEIAESTGLEIFRTGIVLEGGSIDVNGKGALLTTEQCLLNKNRNPRMGKAEIEQYLRDYLGTTNIVWLGRGIAGDDTDGHVDDISRFVGEDTVVCMTEEDPRDENHVVLKRNHELLSKCRDSEGRRLEVIPIAMPRKLAADDGRLPASYANFYIGNSVVLMPVFGDEKNDTRAIETLSGLLPRRKVVPINCRELVYGFGGIHCITQQQPAARGS